MLYKSQSTIFISKKCWWPRSSTEELCQRFLLAGRGSGDPQSRTEIHDYGPMLSQSWELRRPQADRDPHPESLICPKINSELLKTPFPFHLSSSQMLKSELSMKWWFPCCMLTDECTGCQAFGWDRDSPHVRLYLGAGDMNASRHAQLPSSGFSNWGWRFKIWNKTKQKFQTT